jgi:hypothetical protein
MIVDNLLSKLHKVKNTGKGRWMACCPAHDDRTPSLLITEHDNGVIGLHCFAECASNDVLGAVGMEFKDLYPEKLTDHIKPLRRPFPAADVLEALLTETLITYIAASRVADGETLNTEERKRLHLAAQRIMAGRDMVSY